MELNKEKLLNEIETSLKSQYGVTDIKKSGVWQLHSALSGALMAEISESWEKSRNKDESKKQAAYFSAEFLMGRLIYNNLLSLGISDTVEELLKANGRSLSEFEEIEDAALGNGGLGRLAACFLDSAATLSLPLLGYGIRYRYGLFRQTIEDGFQREYADCWMRFGDPWSVRREEDIVPIEFSDMTVNAVPYDMPIIGYGAKHIGTLRLWQAEPQEEFSFQLFNDQSYDRSVAMKNRAEDISRVLYPNDSTRAGKLLRLRQQYFFSAAGIRDMVRSYVGRNGGIDGFETAYAAQLNDTHPVIAIPELIRILTDEYKYDFDRAFLVSKSVFSYTNHTIMAEALESWDMGIVRSISNRIAEIIKEINVRLAGEIRAVKLSKEIKAKLRIIKGGRVNMAYMACYVSHAINGVAKIHSEIIKESVLSPWYKLYPERFQNKTNGITQRRWLLLNNRELSSLITELLGNERWVTDLNELQGLTKFAEDKEVLKRFIEIKNGNKRRLCDYIKRHEGVEIPPHFLFDIQIKRLHEYKRQLLNALVVLDTYFGLKSGEITCFTPTAYIFGAKAAPGYRRAKAIIHFICEIAGLINNDPDMSDKMRVVFVGNYNVSYAERLVSAADLSTQISTAGTEASGTGNMKFMLNGVPTIGTYDGANIEIVKASGEENNYIFGARVEDIEKIKDTYDPKAVYNSERRIKRALDMLKCESFSDPDGDMAEVFTSILEGASWHKADNYYLLNDFLSYAAARQRAGEDFKDELLFAKKGWLNMCYSGEFSSDRTIKQYANEIWNIK